ncbi:hypothetical protein LX36DRAFT_660211 [Colletotrichum falcatum]|nr:hypothetical protein LX36DRAFT_660211 [Colletotrichum falcatum]
MFIVHSLLPKDVEIRAQPSTNGEHVSSKSIYLDHTSLHPLRFIAILGSCQAVSKPSPRSPAPVSLSPFLTFLARLTSGGRLSSS